MQIELLEAAQAELDQAIEYYARESAGTELRSTG